MKRKTMASKQERGSMKKSRFSDEQIVKILREADREPVAEVAKRHAVSEQSIYVRISAPQGKHVEARVNLQVA